MRQVQTEKNGNGVSNGEEKAEGEERVRLDGGGFYDTEIYESRSSKYAHYNQSIAVDDNEVSVVFIYHP